MATSRVPPPESFDFAAPEEWPKWLRRFQRFRIASDLASAGEEAQVNTLIYCMGDRADNVLKSFQLSTEDGKKYEVVCQKFNGHFVARKNVIYERARFNSRHQEPDEPAETFITSLYTLAEHCDYGTLHDEMIRDRIVVGIQDRKLSEKLQLDSTLTLEKAITTVRQAETVKKQQPVIRGARVEEDNPVQAIRRDAQSTTRQTPQSCRWCGKIPAHERRKCPARSATCYWCGKHRHFQTACRAPPQTREIHTESSDEEAFLGGVVS